MIAFAWSLPHMMNNCQNAECQIRQCESQWTGSASSTMTPSPQPQLLKPLPPSGAHMYHPPVLQDHLPHLNLETRHPDAMLVAAHAPTPSHGITYADLLTQVISCSYCKAAVGPDLDLSQENSKKSKNPSSLPMVISWTPPCMLWLWLFLSILLKKRHS